MVHYCILCGYCAAACPDFMIRVVQAGAKQAMSDENCICSVKKPGEVCPVCAESALPLYWCDSCGQSVAEKRCPLCGLKARKVRQIPSSR
jgi:hypothetical protein